MTRTAEKEPGFAFLEQLLMLCERNPDRTRRASAAPDYDELRTADMIVRFEASMQAAARAGAVEIKKGKRERRHLIERVSVADATALARHLGRSPASIVARQARGVLQPLVESAEPWIVALLDKIESRWARGEAAWRLPPGDTALASEFLTLLVALSKGHAQGLDARTFSLKAAADTKAFDRHAARLAEILAVHFGEPEMPSDLVWSRVGLERFAHPVYLRGNVIVEDARGILVHGRAAPFASIHPDMLPLLKLTGQPRLLLTIENYASFNRYIREIADDALVVYTGGFASSGVVNLLRSLLNQLDASVPFFHWGDIDPGGVKIFRFLEENLPRPPQPHLMDRDIAKAHGKVAPQDRTLDAVAESDSALAGLAAWLAHGDCIWHLEQEALDPISPVPGGGHCGEAPTIRT